MSIFINLVLSEFILKIIHIYIQVIPYIYIAGNGTFILPNVFTVPKPLPLNNETI